MVKLLHRARRTSPGPYPTVPSAAGIDRTPVAKHNLIRTTIVRSLDEACMSGTHPFLLFPVEDLHSKSTELGMACVLLEDLAIVFFLDHLSAHVVIGSQLPFNSHCRLLHEDFLVVIRFFGSHGQLAISNMYDETGGRLDQQPDMGCSSSLVL